MATMQQPPKLFALKPAGSAREREPDARETESALPAWEEVPATNWRERLAKRFGGRKLSLLVQRHAQVRAELRAIPRRMQQVTNQARLVLELIDDVRSGAYRGISWISLAVAAACLVYAVSPADVVPDALPFAGAVDDLVVLTLGMRFLEKDLRAYCRFKGYTEGEYFGA